MEDEFFLALAEICSELALDRRELLPGRQYNFCSEKIPQNRRSCFARPIFSAGVGVFEPINFGTRIFITQFECLGGFVLGYFWGKSILLNQ